MKPKNTRYLILLGAVALAITAGLVSLDPVYLGEGPATLIVRGAALLGYQAVFLSILSSRYLRELVRFFGRPFVKVHHAVAISGLVLLTVHPIAAILRVASASLLVPRLDSLRVFLSFGGQMAWPLIALAVIAALLRKRMRRRWRVIHYLNYVAFLLASAHAALFGTTFAGQDLRHLLLRIIIAAMALSVIAVFVQRRRATPRRRPARS